MIASESATGDQDARRLGGMWTWTIPLVLIFKDNYGCSAERLAKAAKAEITILLTSPLMDHPDSDISRSCLDMTHTTYTFPDVVSRHNPASVYH
jgi:hypothetical protein